LANTGTFDKVFFGLDAEGVLVFTPALLDIDTITFTITNTNGLDEWLFANTEGVSV
jgi:hypothetical protein